jgi:hypothetical protein
MNALLLPSIAFFIVSHPVEVAAAIAALVWYRERLLPMWWQYYGGLLSLTGFNALVPVATIAAVLTLPVIFRAPEPPYSYDVVDLAGVSHKVSLPTSSDSPAGGFVMLCGWVVASIAGSVFSAKTLRRAREHYRAVEARDIYRMARRRQDCPYYLYLRSLNLGFTVMRNPRRARLPIFPSFYTEPRLVDFDYYIQDSMPEAVVAIGRGAEELSGRCLSFDDYEWRNAFEVLAEASLGILVVPSASEGLLWELNKLRDSTWLEKTIFIEPPGFSSHRWRQTSKELGIYGITLPEHSTTGMVFKLNSDWSPAAVTNISAWEWRNPPRGFAAVATQIYETHETQVLRRECEANPELKPQ